jgi:hypothetical protein
MDCCPLGCKPGQRLTTQPKQLNMKTKSKTVLGLLSLGASTWMLMAQGQANGNHHCPPPPPEDFDGPPREDDGRPPGPPSNA